MPNEKFMQKLDPSKEPKMVQRPGLDYGNNPDADGLPIEDVLDGSLVPIEDEEDVDLLAAMAAKREQDAQIQVGKREQLVQTHVDPVALNQADDGEQGLDDITKVKGLLDVDQGEPVRRGRGRPVVVAPDPDPKLPELPEEPKRPRGRPPLVEPEVEVQAEQQKGQEEHIESHQPEVFVKVPMQQVEGDIALKVLDYVCKQTILNLVETHESKIYTKEYAKQLMMQYVDGKTDSSNPLFKQLVQECLEQKAEDQYLKGLTEEVLRHIMQ